MARRRLKYFGWGREGEGMTAEEEAFTLRKLTECFGIGRFEEMPTPRLEEITLGLPRVIPPASLNSICSTELYDRVAHTYGKVYPDYARALNGDYGQAPDVVAYPRNEAEVAAVLDWAAGTQAAVTPFGEGAAGRWRTAFIRMPYARERTIKSAIVNDTFETAITWERFETFHDQFKAATEAAIRDVTGRYGGGHLSLHPRLPGWTRALFCLSCARPSRPAH